MGTYPQVRERADRFGLLKAYESLQMCNVAVRKKPQLFLLLKVHFSIHLNIPMAEFSV